MAVDVLDTRCTVMRKMLAERGPMCLRDLVPAAEAEIARVTREAVEQVIAQTNGWAA